MRIRKRLEHKGCNFQMMQEEVGAARGSSRAMGKKEPREEGPGSGSKGRRAAAPLIFLEVFMQQMFYVGEATHEYLKAQCHTHPKKPHSICKDPRKCPALRPDWETSPRSHEFELS